MGEELDWHRVASHLSMTVDEARETISSTGFLKWVWFLEWKDITEFRREDHYLAQIAATMERCHVKHPSKVKDKDKLIVFSRRKRSKPIDPAMRMQKSKNFWLGHARAHGMKTKR